MGCGASGSRSGIVGGGKKTISRVFLTAPLAFQPISQALNALY
jgi:hypothetical protein